MSREAWLQPLAEIAGCEDFQRQLVSGRGIKEISGCLESQKAHIAAGLSQGSPAVLLVVENELRARELQEDLQFFCPEVLLLPRRDILFYDADIAGNLIARQRMEVIRKLLSGERTVVVASAGACMERLLPARRIREHVITIRSAQTADIGELARALVERGYERCAEVETAGQFSVRGGIVDVYSLAADTPWRIEFWGDEVDSIRSFDPESQRSIENLQEIEIFPATEEPGLEEGPEFYRRLTDTIFDYLPPESPIFLDEPVRILESAGAIIAEYREAMTHRLESGQILPEAADRMLSEEEFRYLWELRGAAALCLLELRRSDFAIGAHLSVNVRSVNSYNGQFPLLIKDMHNWKRSGYRVCLASPSRTRGQRLAETLRDEGLNAFFSEEETRVPAPGEVLVTAGRLRRGFEYPLQKWVLVSETDIFGSAPKKRKQRANQSAGQRIRDFSELATGDLVVHESHGLGVYRGLEKVTVDRVTKDYIKIEYAGGSNLYIQATQLDALQKYAGGGQERKPKLNTLGGKAWESTKSRVRAAVKDIAEDLVRLYAARSGEHGHCFGPDTVWQREFEELFPFEETEDQLAAIEDTKRDMESPKIMDRLICGDVGYGKTEIAIRAAFKAAQDNKQVAVLVPTTILAQQHYNTFVQRMHESPVRVDVLSRFRTAAEQKKTLEDLRKGQVDILIGTHRLLSKDVVFKDLGLLVIDEEQRFGVTHKEKIKQLKDTVDVLTLTATPIPRTLHMSLVGIRDMSILEEPPLDRMPIQTYVMEYNEELVREAISRELARDGQVYYVYNRTNNIADVTRRIQEMIPQASVAYAHGQMREQELEQIMYHFVNGEIDVLVSTTIIETGMDISNVNTIIVHDADRFGLAQLYQLRGRVGRTNRNAFAFLMYRRDRILPEEAEKRLHAIREFTELGSGVRIAMRDLEIRGAGNLLGAEQHGHMEAVGYDLYCKLLGEAVREAKGIKKEEDFETVIDLVVDAYIPPDYIPDEGQKLDIYKRIAGMETVEDEDNMRDELIDRYGDPPASVLNLIAVSGLRHLAHRCFATEVKQVGSEVKINLFENAGLDVSGIPDLLARHGETLRFRAAGKPCFLLELQRGSALAQTREFLEELEALRLA